MTLTLLAAGALLTALIALAVALTAWRKADDAEHRLDPMESQAHRHVRTPAGMSKPMPELRTERRDDDLGPPPGTLERRGAHAAPDQQRARRRDRDDPQWRTLTETQTEQLPVTELPTTAMPVSQPGSGPVRLPPPGAIGGR